MSRKIPLTKNRFALVDDSDFEWLNKYKWCIGGNGYPVATIEGKKTYMHRIIAGTPKGMDTDHLDHDTFNNQRSNLRWATTSQNCANAQPIRGGKSVFKGVVWSQKRWQAKIQVNGQALNLGRYLTQREAATAYNEAAILHFGEFACLNDLSALSTDLDQPVPHITPVSSYIGVSYDKRRNKWSAEIMIDRKRIRKSGFTDETDAARAYDSFVKKHGLDRPLNFPT